jgi:hypothetical protein
MIIEKIIPTKLKVLAVQRVALIGLSNVILILYIIVCAGTIGNGVACSLSFMVLYLFYQVVDLPPIFPNHYFNVAIV